MLMVAGWLWLCYPQESSPLARNGALSIWMGLRVSGGRATWADGTPVTYIPDGVDISSPGCYVLTCPVPQVVDVNADLASTCSWAPRSCTTQLPGFVCTMSEWLVGAVGV